jgi:tetratricopeptide (TPR) repeat protein
MTVPQKSFLARVAADAMSVAVRHWPESSRCWGEALLAELDEIAEPGKALSWAAGGIFLFFRALLSHFFEWIKLPAGAGFSNAGLAGGGNGPQFPKRSRLLTGAVLLAAVALLCLPVGREAASTIKASWRGFQASNGDRRELEKLAAQAEKERDSKELAFVALTYPDSDKAAEFADRAVALDPNLVWIYASRYWDFQQQWPKDDEHWRRLKDFDPDNAFVFLVAASARSYTRIHGVGVIPGAEADSLEGSLLKDSEWLSDMDKAFRAPRFDSYFERHEELAREGWKKTPGLSPGLIANSLWTHSIPDLPMIQAYTGSRVRQTTSSGGIREAELTLNELIALGKHATDFGPTYLAKSIGITFTNRGLAGLKKLYRESGQTDKERQAEAEMREVETASNSLVHTYIEERTRIASDFRRKAILLQISALLALFLAVASVFSLLVLESSPALRWSTSKLTRRIACTILDYGPALFLGASVIFLISFRPLAAVFEQIRSADDLGTQPTSLFWHLFALSDANPLLFFYEPYHQWLAGTVLLVVIALIVIVRGLVRPKAASPAR